LEVKNVPKFKGSSEVRAAKKEKIKITRASVTA